MRVPCVRLVRVGAVGAVVVLAAVPGASGAQVQRQSAPVLQKAREVHLSAAQSDLVLTQVACPSLAGCVATFSVVNEDPPFATHLLVLGERRGKWTRQAILAGSLALALACPSLGSCVAAGSSSGTAVMTQSGRGWHASVVQPPGNPDSTSLSSVSCGAAGDCVAVGRYEVGYVENHALLVGEQDRAWGAGFDAQLPADAATTPSGQEDPEEGGVASVVSCSSAGNCAVGGTYTDTITESSGPVYRSEGWVATEEKGHWGRGISVQLPAGADTLGTGEAMSGTSPFIGFTGMSCASAGNCTAVGGYEGVGGEHGLILTERHGVWQRGIRAPGGFEAGTANSWIDPLGPVSCADPNDCAAVASSGWLLTKRHGKWSASFPGLPRGTTAPGGVFLNSVSCPSRGNCVAAGSYASHGKTNGLIYIERDGKWQRALRASLPKDAMKAARQHGGLDSVSCPATNRCTIIGTYTDRKGKSQGLILNLRIR